METGRQIQNEKIDVIITSPLKRAKETAEIINKNFNVSIIQDDRLIERKYGRSEGATTAVKCYFENYPLENLVGRENVEALKNCEVVKFKKRWTGIDKKELEKNKI